MKILIVEDNPVDRKLLCAILEDGGDEAVSGASLESVREALRTDRPDIILLDLNLPGADGLTLVRELRADPQTRCVPVVAMTAYPLRYGPREAMEAGCTAFIVKPVNTRSLSAQLRSIAANEAASG